MRFLYDTGLLIYGAGIRIASFWNPKARLWVDGRKNLFPRLKQALEGKGHPRVWMHCASLGEFEQGRPVLESIRKSYPNAQVILSFFSPSGYEIRKNYEGANLVCYLPMDSGKNARPFMQIMDPDLAIFVKYEFWHHYLDALKKRNTPTLIISAIFRPSQPFFKPWGGFWRGMLSCFTHIFVQDDASAALIREAGFDNRVTVSGDTRFDRVIAVREKWEDIPTVRDFCRGHRVLVAGSTWPEDEEVIAHYARTRQDMRFIIAPHEIDEAHLADIERRYAASIRYGILSDPGHAAAGREDKNVLLMDNMGMLSKLYAYADITYVGGGFGGAGIHNILEAAVYGKPVIFGPVFEKSREARELLAAGGAFSIQSALEFESLVEELWSDAQMMKQACHTCDRYVREQAGATASILAYIQEKRLLMS
jgi:3-deoxy-D-manno-octulosonic-acid transferase